MPSIGKYEYPLFGPRIIIESLDKIRDSKGVTSVAGVAQVLGHSTHKSGGFFNKLAAMNKYYGVIDKRGDIIELTPLGKKIAYPVSDEERTAAIIEMVLRVPLFKDIYERLGDTFDKSQFFIHLSELAGVERDVAVTESDKIRNLYEEVLPYLRSKAVSKQSIDAVKEVAPMQSVQNAMTGACNVQEGMIRIEISGKSPIILPDKEHYIDSLIKDLEDHKEELRKGKGAVE